MIEFTGARPIPMPMREENGFAFSAEEALGADDALERASSSSIRPPTRPAGSRRKRRSTSSSPASRAFPNAAILSDEIYGQLTYDGLAHQTLLAYPEIRDRLILLDGWSKTYAMTGWRLGYSVWPKAWRDVARKLAVNSYSCVNSAAQFAGIAALKGPQDSVARDARRIRPAAQGGRRGPQPTSGRARGDAEGRVLRFSQYFAARAGKPSPSPRRCLQEAGVATIGGPGFRRPRRGLLAAFLRQLAGEHRTRARAHPGLSQPPRTRSVGPLSAPFRWSPDDHVIMRPLVLCRRGVIALCPLARAEAARPSQAACDAAKIGGPRARGLPENGRRPGRQGTARAPSTPRSNRSTRARACCHRKSRAGAARSMTQRRNGSHGAIRNVRTSRRLKRAWTPKAAIRACAASSTTTRSASRASRRATVERAAVFRSFSPHLIRLAGLEAAKFSPLSKASAMPSTGLTADRIGATTQPQVACACAPAMTRARF